MIDGREMKWELYDCGSQRLRLRDEPPRPPQSRVRLRPPPGPVKVDPRTPARLSLRPSRCTGRSGGHSQHAALCSPCGDSRGPGPERLHPPASSPEQAATTQRPAPRRL